VLIRHDDGLVTVYGHASEIKVSRGDTVQRGQVIALSGMTGEATQPKLHFEVRENATPVNPVSYLGNS
jgi:murein DD-endopeptidase MepM/ murein hydrolase activator NlpD